jgi:excisionase family DNA binding protein
MHPNTLRSINPNFAPKILHSIPEASHALSLSRSKVYELIQSGALKTVKIGQRRLVPAESITALVNSLAEAA